MSQTSILVEGYTDQQLQQVADNMSQVFYVGIGAGVVIGVFLTVLVLCIWDAIDTHRIRRKYRLRIEADRLASLNDLPTSEARQESDHA